MSLSYWHELMVKRKPAFRQLNFWLMYYFRAC